MIYRITPNQTYSTSLVHEIVPVLNYYACDISIKPTVSGAYNPANEYAAAITLKKISVTASAGATSLNIELPKLTVSGSCYEINTGSMVVGVKKLTVAGALGAESPSYDLNAKLKKMTLSGGVSPRPLWAMSAALKKLTISALSQKAPATTVTIQLNKMLVTGAMATQPTYAAAIALNKLRLAGEVLSEYSAEATTDSVWVVNLETGGHWTYSGFPFNSLVRYRDEYYLANDSGLFKVETPSIPTVVGTIETPTFSFNRQYTSYIHDMYLQCRGNNELTLTTITDEDWAVDYDVSVRESKEGRHVKRVKLAKGVRGNNWSFKMKNVAGSRLDLSLIDIRPINGSRSY